MYDKPLIVKETYFDSYLTLNELNLYISELQSII